MGAREVSGFGRPVEPQETVIASAEAVYVYAGRLEDGTQVVRDAGGVLHALVAVKRICDT